MRPSLDELKTFYASPDGRRTARLLASIVAPKVQRHQQSRLLALGYAAPLFAGFSLATIERLALVMPAAHGAHAWPPHSPRNCALSAKETELPFAAAMFDQAILCHSLEFNNAPKLLRELWRVLSPAGDIILIVPNRAGLWTHFETTPFGRGQPYGRGGLLALLREAMFEPVEWRTALAAPPVKGVRWLDRPLTRLLPAVGGIHFVLARKTDGLRPMPVGRVRRAVPARAAEAYARPDELLYAPRRR